MITKSAHSLLERAFTVNGRCACSAVDTCEGTMPLWGQLTLAGLVKPRTMPTPLGHTFSYEITEQGRKLLDDSWSPYDHPFYCRTCSNCFATRAQLIEHRQRKHSHIVPVFPLWKGDNQLSGDPPSGPSATR